MQTSNSRTNPQNFFSSLPFLYLSYNCMTMKLAKPLPGKRFVSTTLRKLKVTVSRIKET